MSVAEQLRKAMTEPAPPKGDEAPAKPPVDEKPAEPSSGPEAPPAGGSSKGQERPGHKYTRREQLPGGGYRYFYGTEGQEQSADIDDSHWSMEDGFRASPAAQLLAGVPIEDAKRVYAVLKSNAQLTDAQRTEKLHALADAASSAPPVTNSEGGSPAKPAGHGDAGTPFPELPKTPENGGQNAQAQTASRPTPTAGEKQPAPAAGAGVGAQGQTGGWAKPNTVPPPLTVERRDYAEKMRRYAEDRAAQLSPEEAAALGQKTAARAREATARRDALFHAVPDSLMDEHLSTWGPDSEASRQAAEKLQQLRQADPEGAKRLDDWIAAMDGEAHAHWEQEGVARGAASVADQLRRAMQPNSPVERASTRPVSATDAENMRRWAGLDQPGDVATPEHGPTMRDVPAAVQEPTADNADPAVPASEQPIDAEPVGQGETASEQPIDATPAEQPAAASVADQVRQAMRPPSEEEAAGAAIANASEDEATRKLDEAKAKVAARYIPQIQKTSAEIERLQAEMDRLKANPTKPDLSDLHAKAAARAKASHEAYNAERARIQAEPEARRRVKERLAADETHQAERKELNDLREAARTGYATPEESARQEALNSSLRRRRNAAVKAETEKVVAEMRAAGKIKDEPFEMPKMPAERGGGATAAGTGGEDIRERLQRRTAELRASSAEKDKRLADMLEAAQRTTPQQEAMQAERLRAQQLANERRQLAQGEYKRRIQENSPSAIMNQLRVLFGRLPLSDIDTETGKLLPPRLLWGGDKPSVADQVRQTMQPAAATPASEQSVPAEEQSPTASQSVADQLRRVMQSDSPVERASTRPVSATDTENIRRWAGLSGAGDVPAASVADQLRQAMQPNSPVERASTRPVSATDAENMRRWAGLDQPGDVATPEHGPTMRDVPAAVPASEQPLGAEAAAVQEPTADDANPAVPASEQPIDAAPVGQGAAADDANPAVPASEQPPQASVADQVRQTMQPKRQQKASARVAEISEAPANLREQLGVEPTVTAEKVREHFGLDVPESLRPAPPSDLQRAERKVDKVFRDLWDRREEDPQAKAALEKQFAKRPQLKRDLEAWEAAKNAGVQDVSKQVLAEDNPAIPNEEEPAADAAAISIVHHEADGKSEAEAIQETKDTVGEKAAEQGQEQLAAAPGEKLPVHKGVPANATVAGAWQQYLRFPSEQRAEWLHTAATQAKVGTAWLDEAMAEQSKEPTWNAEKYADWPTHSRYFRAREKAAALGSKIPSTLKWAVEAANAPAEQTLKDWRRQEEAVSIAASLVGKPTQAEKVNDRVFSDWLKARQALSDATRGIEHLRQSSDYKAKQESLAAREKAELDKGIAKKLEQAVTQEANAKERKEKEAEWNKAIAGVAGRSAATDQVREAMKPAKPNAGRTPEKKGGKALSPEKVEKVLSKFVSKDPARSFAHNVVSSVKDGVRTQAATDGRRLVLHTEDAKGAPDEPFPATFPNIDKILPRGRASTSLGVTPRLLDEAKVAVAAFKAQPGKDKNSLPAPLVLGDVDGAPVGIDPRYLVDALNTYKLDSDEVVAHLYGGNQGIVLEGPNFKHLIAPLREGKGREATRVSPEATRQLTRQKKQVTAAGRVPDEVLTLLSEDERASPEVLKHLDDLKNASDMHAASVHVDVRGIPGLSRESQRSLADWLERPSSADKWWGATYADALAPRGTDVPAETAGEGKKPSVADQVRETMQPAVREKDAGGEKSTNQGEEQLGASLSEEKPSVADQVREAMQPAVEQPNVEAASEKKAKPAQTESKRAKATGAAGEKPSVADQVREAMQPAGEEEPVDEHLSGYSSELQQAIREAAQNPDDLGAAAELMMEETGKDERSARNAVRALASRMTQAVKAADPDNRLVQIAGMAEDPEWLKEDFKAALSAPQKLKKHIKEMKGYVGGRHLTTLEQIEASLKTEPFSEVRETFARWRGDRRKEGKDTEFADGSVILPLYDRGEEKQHREEAAAWEKNNRRTDGKAGTAWWEWAEHLLDWQRDGKRSLARLRPVDSAALAKNSGTPRAADPVAVAKFRILGPEDGRSIKTLPKDLQALLPTEDDTKANREALLDALDTGFVEAAIHRVNQSVAVKKSTLAAIQRWFEAQKGVLL